MTPGGQRILGHNSLGRKTITRSKSVANTRIIHVFYCNRAMEWINMKRLFSEIFIFLSIPQFMSALLNLMFAWTYHPNVSMYCYKPSMVFKNFDVSTLKDNMDKCICYSSRRFAKFLDKDTCDINGEGIGNKGHVRTMDLNIVQYK